MSSNAITLTVNMKSSTDGMAPMAAILLASAHLVADAMFREGTLPGCDLP
jgi:hypothetical protein